MGVSRRSKGATPSTDEHQAQGWVESPPSTRDAAVNPKILTSDICKIVRSDGLLQRDRPSLDLMIQPTDPTVAYRRGDHAKARSWLERCVQGGREPMNAGCQALHGFFLAMAQHRLGKHDEAAKAYEQARKIWAGLRTQNVSDLELSSGDDQSLRSWERDVAHVVDPILADGPERLTRFRDEIEDDRTAMALKNFHWRLITGAPDSNARVRAGRRHAAILQKCRSVHRAVVKPQY